LQVDSVIPAHRQPGRPLEVVGQAVSPLAVFEDDDVDLALIGRG
jgi:hypothetical protein